MITQASTMLLFIEPQYPKSEEPVIDDLTRKMAAAITTSRAGILAEKFREGGVYRGTQRCLCGATSTAQDYLLASGFITNSLCVHYLAWHRNEVPQTEIDKVSSLADEYAEPTTKQLQ